MANEGEKKASWVMSMADEGERERASRAMSMEDELRLEMIFGDEERGKVHERCALEMKKESEASGCMVRR